MHIDGGIPAQLGNVADAVQRVERRGYDAAWTGEVNHDPFLAMALAAEHSTTLQLGTSIAVAFARTPMTLANVGWDLQGYSQGRFVLGLGSQIRPHIEKRFGMPWSKPVARMREFVAALHAIWSCWQDGTPLAFEGEYYTHKLMTPMFTPEPHGYGVPKIFVAAVGEAMTEMCGEVADGVHVHAFTTERYLREVTSAALERGLQRAGRTRTDVQISCPVFTVTGETDEETAAAATAVRQQIAFYASTPAYRGVLDLHGWGDLQPELRALSLQGEWEAMGKLIDDDILDTFALVAPLDRLGVKARERYEGVADRIMLTLPPALPDEVAAGIIAAARG
jgi:probable F420-dependent oxidoreductase